MCVCVWGASGRRVSPDTKITKHHRAGAAPALRRINRFQPPIRAGGRAQYFVQSYKKTNQAANPTNKPNNLPILFHLSQSVAC